jgi:hypothetical protein
VVWIVTAALRREDLFLRRYLQPYAPGGYEAWTPGIGSLYETGIVYLLLRELWQAGYQRALSWKYPYPEWPGARADLVIFRQRPEQSVRDCYPERVIEVKKKWCSRNKAEQLAVWWDLLRLLWFEHVDHHYELLLTFGAEETALGQDVADMLELRLGGNAEQCTLEQLVFEVIYQEVQFRPYYLQHFAGVREVLWEEFESYRGHNTPGKVRVSVVEVFRR